ncbi:MAG: M42 family metallopeptidase [Anaerolineales bacterium]|nr:M42 family metallopeptidase [Anaerolineales bacterium]
MKSLLQKLTGIPGPSGYESEIRAAIRSEIEPLAEEVRVDNLGNLIAIKKGNDPKGQVIMLAAHMDEIGLIATHIDPNGFVRFTTIGGVFPHSSLAGRVHFLNGSQGVIGQETPADINKIPTFDKMFIDIGATSSKDCPVQVGDLAVFDQPFLDLGDRLVSKAMDDRIGVAILIETLQQIDTSPNTLLFVFSTQEEVGVRGASTAAFSLEPDIGIAVDVTRSGDTPKGVKMEVALGKGPAIKVRDSGMISDPRVVDWMVSTAEKAKLPYQIEVLERGSTDARAIQISRAGVPAGCISIPCRYIHSPSEMVDLKDAVNSVRLLVELLNQKITFNQE